MTASQKLSKSQHPPFCIFDGVGEDINTLIKRKKHLAEISDGDFLKPLLNAKSLKAFFIWFINSPNFHHALSYAIMMAHIPKVEERLTAISVFSEEGDSALKNVEQHLLTRKEFNIAQDYLANTNRAMLYASNIIEQGLEVFLEYLSENLDLLSSYFTVSPISSAAHSALDILKGTLWLSAVTQEFMPVIALHCEKAEEKHQERAIAKGLKRCFAQRSAFDSEIGGARITCPIKGSIAHLINMTLEQDENGQWIEGDPAHGGLILSLIKIINDLEQEPKIKVAPAGTTPIIP